MYRCGGKPGSEFAMSAPDDFLKVEAEGRNVLTSDRRERADKARCVVLTSGGRRPERAVRPEGMTSRVRVPRGCMAVRVFRPGRALCRRILGRTRLFLLRVFVRVVL